MTSQEIPNEENMMVAAAATSSSGGHSFSNHKPIMQNKPPSGRGGASCVYADGKLVVFGGHYFEGGESFAYLNEVWLLDVNKLLWHKVVCTGEIPGPRFGHSCHLLGSRMFIFGGKGPKDIVYKDVYFLDLIEWVWVPVNSVSGGPTARFGHASEVVGRKIVVHGGWDGDEVFNDFWIFNTDSFVWSQPRTTGFGPSPRYGHTLTLTVDGRLLIFGGCTINEETGIPKYNDDVRQLDTDTMVWSRPRVNGQTPTGRYGHSSTLLSDGRVLVYGGWGRGGCQSKDIIDNALASTVHILDTKTMTWFIPRKLGRKELKHLYNHAACRSSANTVFLFGGFDGRQAIGDFYVVNLEYEESY